MYGGANAAFAGVVCHEQGRDDEHDRRDTRFEADAATQPGDVFLHRLLGGLGVVAADEGATHEGEQQHQPDEVSFTMSRTP